MKSINQEAIKATVIILTKNEEKHIKRAVESAYRFDQILVVDSHSDDETVRIAEEAGAHVVDFSWNGAYPKKKEWALQHSKNDWVVYLDADEYFSDKLAEEILTKISEPGISALEAPLTYYWLGKELQYGHKVSKRIGMKISDSEWPQPNDLDVKNMWEVEGHYQPQVKDGSVARLHCRLSHDDTDGLFDYFARHNRYSDWEANMIYKKDSASLESRSKLGRIAVNLPMKPVVFFLYSFIAKSGFRDGRKGFSYAMALSFYYWQIGIKINEIKETQGKR